MHVLGGTMHEVMPGTVEGGPPVDSPLPAAEHSRQIQLRLPSGQVVVIATDLALATAAFLLIAVHTVATVLRLRGAWWWQDDFNMLDLTADQPLTPGLLLRDYNGHLQPASWLMAWTVTHLSPYA